MTVEDEDFESASPKRREIREARAWKRALLATDGGISADGRTILRGLMQMAQFFGRQYEIGNHDRTLELAVKRQVVVHVLNCLDISEAQIKKILEVRHDE